jgi:hypothetical protein
MQVITTINNNNYIQGCFPPVTAIPGQVFFDSGCQSMVVYDGVAWQTIDFSANSMLDVSTQAAIDWALNRIESDANLSVMATKYPLVADAIGQLEVALKLCMNLDKNND